VKVGKKIAKIIFKILRAPKTGIALKQSDNFLFAHPLNCRRHPFPIFMQDAFIWLRQKFVFYHFKLLNPANSGQVCPNSSTEENNLEVVGVEPTSEELVICV